MAFVVVISYTNESFDPNIKATVYNFLMNTGSLSVAFMGPILQLFKNPFSFYAIVSIIPIFIFYIFEEEWFGLKSSIVKNDNIKLI